MPKKERPIVGIQLPITKGTKRSSTPFNKGIWKAAVQTVGSSDAKRFVEKIEKEKNWRWDYMKYVEDSMRIGSKSDDTVEMAKAAWQYVYKNLEYFPEVGAQPMTIGEAMENPNPNGAFESVVIQGSAEPETQFSIMMPQGKMEGAQAKNLLEKWADDGVVESDTAAALQQLVSKPGMISEMKNKIFVLLGGLSEMGPLQRLLSFGCTVVALDYHAKPLQERLIKIGNESAGRLILPMKPGSSSLPDSQWAENAGCDLLLNFPEVAEWLVNLEPEKEMVIGSFCYLDGEMFIKIVATMDAICATVVKRRNTPTTLSYYATPTDCHLVTPECVKASYNQTQSGLARLFTMLCKPGYDKRNIVAGHQFTSSLVSRQGPNYCVAKRLQTFRAIVNRANGHNVSLNVAPTTKTASVMKNAIFAFTMEGFDSMKPFCAFETETTKSVMTGLLIHDLANPQSSANATTELDHPLQLLQKTQCHGGMYRTGLLFNSMGNPAFLLAVVQKYWWALPAVAVIVFFCRLLLFV